MISIFNAKIFLSNHGLKMTPGVVEVRHATTLGWFLCYFAVVTYNRDNLSNATIFHSSILSAF